MLIFLQVLQVILGLGFLALMGYLAFIMISFKNIVPYVPTPRRCLKRMVRLAEIKKNEKICDLGSGTGRIIFYIANRYKHNMIIGIEKSMILRIFSRLKLIYRFNIAHRVQIIKRNFFNIDLHNFDVIFCFLTPEALRILNPKLKLIKRGSRIISYMFPLEDHHGFEEQIDHVSAKDSIYVYKKI